MQLCQRLGRHSGGRDRVGVDAGNRFGIGLHSGPKGHDALREYPKVIAAGKELHKPAHLGKGRLELCQGLSGSGRGLYRAGVDAGHRLAVGFHRLAEGDDALGKFPKVIPAGEEFHDAAYIGEGRLEPGQRLSRSSGGGYRPGIDAGYGVSVGIHGLAEGENPLCEQAKIVAPGKEAHHPSHMGKRCLELCQGLGGDNRGGNRPRVHSAHRVGIGLHALSKGEKAVCEGLQVVAAGKEIHHAANIGQRGLQLRKGLRRSGGGGYGCAVHAGHAVRVGLHRLPEGHQLFPEGLKVVVACEEGHQAPGVGQGVCQLHQGLSGDRRAGDRVGIQPRHLLGIAFDGRPEGHQLLAEGGKVVVASEEGYGSAGVGQSSRQLRHGLSGNGGIGDRLHIKPLDRVGIGFDGRSEGYELFAEVVHVVVAGKEAHRPSCVGEGGSQLRHGLTGDSSILNRVGVQPLDACGKLHHGAAEAHKLVAEGPHVVFSGKESRDAAAVGQDRGHLSQCLSSDCRRADQVAVQSGNAVGEFLHSLAEGHQLLGKGGKGRAAGEPGGQTLQQIGRRNQHDRPGEGLDALQHGRVDTSCPVDKGLYVGHKGGQVHADLGEGAGYPAHKSAHDAADKATNGVPDGLQELTTLADEPLQAGDLRQRAHRRQNNGQLCDDNAQTKHTHHGGGDQSGQSAQRHHNAAQQADSGDALQQRVGVDASQRRYDAGEEGHQQVHHRLDQGGHVAGQPVDHRDQELHDGVHDLGRIGHQGVQHPGNQLQSALGDGRDTLHQNVHHGEDKGLDGLANGRSAIRNDLCKGHHRLTQLLRNGRDQRRDARDDRGQAGHDNGYARSKGGCQGRNAHRNGG